MTLQIRGGTMCNEERLHCDPVAHRPVGPIKMKQLIGLSKPSKSSLTTTDNLIL